MALTGHPVPDPPEGGPQGRPAQGTQFQAEFPTCLIQGGRKLTWDSVSGENRRCHGGHTAFLLRLRHLVTHRLVLVNFLEKGTGNIKWQRGKILETPGWMTGGCVKDRGLAWGGEGTRHQVHDVQGAGAGLFPLLIL